MKQVNPIIKQIIEKRTIKGPKTDFHTVVVLLNDGYVSSGISDDGEEVVNLSPFPYDEISEYTQSFDITDEFVKSEFTTEDLESKRILILTPTQIAHINNGRLTETTTFESSYRYTLVMSTLNVKDVFL